MSDVSGSKILLCNRSKPRKAYVPGEDCVTYRHVTMNMIRSCDCIRVVMKVLRPVYARVMVLRQYCKY